MSEQKITNKKYVHYHITSEIWIHTETIGEN